jgi:outer membrane protein
VVLLAVSVFACRAAGAQEAAKGATAGAAPTGEPLWEVGVFGVAGRLPHYRGSDEYQVYVLPLPFLIYRGEVVEADRDGARSIFWKRSWGELDFSFYGNPPVVNDDAREGMPDLDPLVEAGPAWRLYLHRGQPTPDIYLLAAVRGVVSISMNDLRPSYEGLRGVLGLYLKDYQLSRESPWKFGGSVGMDVADDTYNSYFYDVSDEQARPGRAAYRSSSGYGGFCLSGYVVRKLTRALSWSVYARWDNINGAVYADSPLVRENNNVVLGTALAWTLAESSARAHKNW